LADSTHADRSMRVWVYEAMFPRDSGGAALATFEAIDAAIVSNASQAVRRRSVGTLHVGGSVHIEPHVST
jgi:hypothetical protein